MSCRSEDLPLLAIGRLTGLTLWRTERHVRTCPTCQEELANLLHLSDSLRAAMQADPSADLDERVLSIRPGALQKSSFPSRSYGGTLIRHPLLLGPLFSISCAAGIAFFQPPMYTATGRVMVVSSSNADSLAAVPTFIELMKAGDIQREVSLRTEKPFPTFTLEAISQTPIVQVTGSGENPDEVAQRVNELIRAVYKKIEAQREMQKRTNRKPDVEWDMRIIDEAKIPTTSNSPNKMLTLAIGLLVGIFLGGLLTFFRRQN